MIWSKSLSSGLSAMEHILAKLDVLRRNVKIWQRHKIQAQQKDLKDIQCELDSLLPQMSSHSLHEDIRYHIYALEIQKKGYPLCY